MDTSYREILRHIIASRQWLDLTKSKHKCSAQSSHYSVIKSQICSWLLTFVIHFNVSFKLTFGFDIKILLTWACGSFVGSQTDWGMKGHTLNNLTGNKWQWQNWELRKKVHFYSPVGGSFFIFKQIRPVLTLFKQLAWRTICYLTSCTPRGEIDP